MSDDSTEWDSRADVLYHFFAYHFFDQGAPTATTLDMVNLDDADVQYFNRTADMTRGLNTGHKLAEYLSSPHAFKLVHHYPAQAQEGYTATTYRHRFIHHVRAYNMTQEPRRRFYLLGLGKDDIDFLGGLEVGKGAVGSGKELIWATDSCLGEHEIGAPSGKIEDVVAEEIQKFMARYRAQNPTKVDEKVLEGNVAASRPSFADQKSH